MPLGPEEKIIIEDGFKEGVEVSLGQYVGTCLSVMYIAYSCTKSPTIINVHYIVQNCIWDLEGKDGIYANLAIVKHNSIIQWNVTAVYFTNWLYTCFQVLLNCVCLRKQMIYTMTLTCNNSEIVHTAVADTGGL